VVPSDRKLREFLLAQSPVWLTDRLLDASASDPALLATLRAAAAGSDRAQVVRRELDRALWVGEGVDWEDAPTYVYQAERALALLEDLLRDGRPDEVIELAEHAIALLAEAVELVADDGDTHGCLVWAREIHTRACVEGNPDPAALAQRLFTLAVADDWGVFTDVVATYADALGPTGVATLRGLIGDELARIPRRTAGAATTDPRDSTIIELAARAARPDGVDAVVDVLARDLTSAHRFEVICQELASAGRVDDALGWARRGLTELDEHVGRPRLRRTAAELAERLGRHDEATELIWADFAAHPTVEGYQRLRADAEADGTWPGWRERALGELRGRPRLTGPAPAGPPAWSAPLGHSVLVDVLLSDGDVHAAWEAAQYGGCSEALWLTLARKRAGQHPCDAIPVFRRHVEAAVELGKRPSYEYAASLLAELGRCYERAGAVAEFAEYVRQLRTTHKRKRAFVAALDAVPIPD
jgi:tetratricopeptide (TPR) repeat protein